MGFQKRESISLSEDNSNFCENSENKNTLGPPVGTSTLNYKFLQHLYSKLSNCGRGFYTLINQETGEKAELPIYCDNKSCTNPDCQKHRLYKYMKKHIKQISELNADMRKPKAWVFSTERKPYPIDREYCRNKMKQLNNLLDIKKHKKYGSKSKFSIHMEIKLYPKDKKYPYPTWYLHFHVVSALIEDLRLVRQLWGGYFISYEKAINPIDLGFYVSKYASKTPYFPDLNSFYEYAQAVYKTKMHSFGGCENKELKETDWFLYEMKGCSNSKVSPSFFEIEQYFEKYLLKAG